MSPFFPPGGGGGDGRRRQSVPGPPGSRARPFYPIHPLDSDLLPRCAPVSPSRRQRHHPLVLQLPGWECRRAPTRLVSREPLPGASASHPAYHQQQHVSLGVGHAAVARGDRGRSGLRGLPQRPDQLVHLSDVRPSHRRAQGVAGGDHVSRCCAGGRGRRAIVPLHPRQSPPRSHLCAGLPVQHLRPRVFRLSRQCRVQRRCGPMQPGSSPECLGVCPDPVRLRPCPLDLQPRPVHPSGWGTHGRRRDEFTLQPLPDDRLHHHQAFLCHVPVVLPRGTSQRHPWPARVCPLPAGPESERASGNRVLCQPRASHPVVRVPPSFSRGLGGKRHAAAAVRSRVHRVLCGPLYHLPFHQPFHRAHRVHWCFDLYFGAVSRTHPLLRCGVRHPLRRRRAVDRGRLRIHPAPEHRRQRPDVHPRELHAAFHPQHDNR